MAEKNIKDILTENNRWDIDDVVVYSALGLDVRFGTNTILDNYRDYFDQNYLVEATVDPEYYYNPIGFANVFYGSPELDYLVLYSSKIFTLYDFNKPTIKLWSAACLNDLNKLIVKLKNTAGPTNSKIFV